MKTNWLAALAAATMLSAVPAVAQQVPKTPAEVARPRDDRRGSETGFRQGG